MKFQGRPPTQGPSSNPSKTYPPKTLEKKQLKSVEFGQARLRFITNDQSNFRHEFHEFETVARGKLAKSAATADCLA